MKITYSPWMRLILPMSGRKRKPLIRPLPTMISTEMCLAKMTAVSYTHLQTVTSGTDGKLTFTGLKATFTYTLSEVSVPSPYVATTTTWKVKLEGSPLRAVLYDSTGTVQQTLDATDGTYHIVNSTQEDIVSQSVESLSLIHI